MRYVISVKSGMLTELPDLPPTVGASVIPAQVTMRQARLALNQAGLLATVESAINALPDPPRTAARIEWDYSNAIQRDNAFVAQLGALLGLTSLQLDELFVTAAQL